MHIAHAQIHVYAHTHTHTDAHTYTHTHMHIYTYTHTRVCHITIASATQYKHLIGIPYTINMIWKKCRYTLFLLQNNEIFRTKSGVCIILILFKLHFNSDSSTYRIAAKIHKVVRSAQHSHGASKVQKAIFEKRPKTRYEYFRPGCTDLITVNTKDLMRWQKGLTDLFKNKNVVWQTFLKTKNPSDRPAMVCGIAVNESNACHWAGKSEMQFL